MSVAAIIQARMGSTRLPGKVLKRLAGETVLAHVVRRVRAIEGVHAVCVATTAAAADDAVAQEAKRLGVGVFRGDERDVLGRYLGAARELDAGIIMRITCDCPLIDPDVCAAVLALREQKNADYASNVAAAAWPHGLDCEVFTHDALERAGQEAVAEEEREHVTLWMRRNGMLRRAELDGPGGAAAHQRWVVDYPEDLEFLETLLNELPPSPAMPGWRDVVTALDGRPDIININQNRVIDASVRAGIVNPRAESSPP